MATWSFTYIRGCRSATPSAIESFIRSESVDTCSLAKDNREYWLRRREGNPWIQISPNGFLSLDEKYAESCKALSLHFGTEVVMTMGQGNCSAMMFAVYDSGQLRRAVGAVEGSLYTNEGKPFDWEQETFGNLDGEEVAIYEGTLKKVARHLGLPGYPEYKDRDGHWSEEVKVSLLCPPPIPE